MQNFKLGSWKVEPNKSLLTSNNGKEVRIEPLNMALLCYFAKTPNEPIGRTKLIEDVWNNKVVTDHALYKTINQLRKYLASDGDEQEYIKTVPKKGYALVADFEPIIETSSKDNPQDPVKITLLHKFKQWFDKHPVLYTLGIFAAFAMFSWNLGLNSWWSQLSYPSYQDIKSNNIVPGFKSEIVPSKEDRYLLVTSQKSEILGKRAVYILHQQTNKFFKLLDHEYDYSKLSWSKSGNKIVASRRPEATTYAESCDLMIYTLNEKFTEIIQQELVANCSPYGSSSFYDDENGKLIYSYTKSEILSANLFELDLNTKEVEVLTNSGEATFGDWSIRVSPDSSKIAFIRVYDEHNELFIMDLSNKEPQLLTSYPTYSDQISWAHNSNQLFFQGQDSKIWVYSLEFGYEKKVLTRDDTIAWSYHSSQSDKIYIIAEDTRQDIRVAGFSNGRLNSSRWLTQTSSSDKFPSFANTSEDIVFVSDRSGMDQVWLYRDDEFSQLTFFNEGIGAVMLPSWSPSDDKILFHQDGKIYLYDFELAEQKLLYQEEGNALYAPMWGHDGVSVFFSKQVDTRKEIFKINIKTDEVKQVTTNGGYAGRTGSNGEFLYYGKEDSEGLWRLNLVTLEDIKISQNINLDSISSLQIYPDSLVFRVSKDYANWTIYRLSLDSLTEEVLLELRVDDGRLNRSMNTIIWSETKKVSNKMLAYEPN